MIKGDKIMNWFRNLKVGSKIIFSCSLFIIMIIIFVVFYTTTMNGVDNSVKDYRENNVIPVIKMGVFAKNLVDARVLMLQLASKDEATLKNFGEKAMKIRDENTAIVKLMQERSMTDAEKATTAEFLKKYEEIGQTLADFLKAVKAGNTDQAQILMNTWVMQYEALTPVLEQISNECLKVGANKIITEFEKIRKIIILMMVILGISVLAGIILTRILSKSISNPVKKGLDFAKKIADGDFTDRIDLNQKDELGMLSNALNQAADKLENMVTEIVNSSNNLAQAVEQIASGNQNLSQRTSEQASALEEVAATIEEANSSINQNYQNSTEAKRMSEVSSTVANQGGELVNEAVQSINEVNSSAKKIGEITNVINEIAFQTNLLALNAAVEAARAGEQGRGFAVVAGEVRNLAQRAGNAAKEIAHLISDTVTKVEDGTEKTYKSGNSLKEIIESVANVARFVGEIAASSNEQKQGMDQIATAISDLDSMTQHNAALVEETASASEEMANQAQELMSLMSLFKIREEKSSSVEKNRVSAGHAAPVKAKEHPGGNGKNMPHAAIAADKKNTDAVLENGGYEKF